MVWAGQSLLILNPRNHCSSPPSAISKCCLILDLNFITSKSHFDVVAMSPVATMIIVCSCPECLKYTKWSTAECLKPKLFIMTAVSVFCHLHLACFKPYNAFFSLQMSHSWPSFSSPAGGTMYTSSLSGTLRYALLMSTWWISQSCWAVSYTKMVWSGTWSI